MADCLAYWKTFWTDFGGPQGARLDVEKCGYGSTDELFWERIERRGYDLWIVVRGDPGRDSQWRLFMRLSVKRLVHRDEVCPNRPDLFPYRVVPDLGKSTFFGVYEQPNFESILKKLEFRTGNRITESGARIGLTIQRIRALSKNDTRLLREYADARLKRATTQ